MLVGKCLHFIFSTHFHLLKQITLPISLMDFFKSVFAEDNTNPTDDDEQKSPKSPQDPNNTNESTFHNTDLNQNPSSSTTPTDTPTNPWNFGGLIKTLASKSETVIQTYKKDLEEFGSGLKKETAIIREVASRAVKDLPSSIETTASAAQESIESVGHVIDEFGSSVWRGTSEIIANSKESLLSNDLDNNSDLDNNNQFGRSSNSKVYSRFEMQVQGIQNDSSTYCDELEDLDEFEKWKLGFSLEESEEKIESLFDENEVMEEIYTKVVPNVVDRETFWNRYFYRVFKLKQAEDARANLVKRAISGVEEELSWDVDDDDVDESKGFESRVDKQETREVEIAQPVVEKEKERTEGLEVPKSDIVDQVVNDEKTVVESVSDNASDEIVKQEEKENHSELVSGELSTKSSEKISLAENNINNHDETSIGSGLPVDATQPSVPEEEDIGWDEIEDLGSHDEKKSTAAGSPNRSDLQKRLSTADDEEDLSWDIEDDDEPVKH